MGYSKPVPSVLSTFKSKLAAHVRIPQQAEKSFVEAHSYPKEISSYGGGK